VSFFGALAAVQNQVSMDATSPGRGRAARQHHGRARPGPGHTRQLDDGWVLDLSVETARSFYVSLAGDARPEAGLGARATAQLSRRFGSRP
jgi:hypothetical protein